MSKSRCSSDLVSCLRHDQIQAQDFKFAEARVLHYGITTVVECRRKKLSLSRKKRNVKRSNSQIDKKDESVNMLKTSSL